MLAKMHSAWWRQAPSGSPIFSLRAIDRSSEGGGNPNRGWSGRRDEASYWPAAGVGEGVGDINPFATCSPASFAPVSATELVLGFGMSATTAGHAEMQAHTRMSATINGGTVFIRLNVLLSFAQFEREVTGERIRDKIAASLIEPSSAVKSKFDHANLKIMS